MRCLVTGGSGFIGSHVVDQLRVFGHDVRIFDLRRSVHAPNCDHFIGSILDMEAIRLAMNGMEAVFHIAAIADVADAMADPSYTEKVNARGTLNVLDAARRSNVSRVIYASTTWVYGECPKEGVDEDTPLPQPNHIYTATKIAGENYCRSYASLYDLPFTVLRYGIPYGPRSRDGAVIPLFVKKALSGEPITISGDGSQFRKFIYVVDLARGNAMALKPVAAGKTYNLDGSRKITIREAAETIRGLVGGAEVVYTEGRRGDFPGTDVSSSRAKKDLGWEPTTDFERGLKQYIRWHMEVRGGVQ